MNKEELNMTGYGDWKSMLYSEDIKLYGCILKRSESELSSLYDIYKSYEPERRSVKARILSRLGDKNYSISDRCAELLVEKCMRAIVSCKNIDQLNVAIAYSSLAYKRLSKDVGLVNKTNFQCLIDRSIGFAQCNIKSRH